MSDITDADLNAIGRALLNTVSAVIQLGHASPASLLDYLDAIHPNMEGHFAPLIVKDFVAWTSGRISESPKCEERLTEFVKQSGWYRDVVNSIGQRLSA